MMRRTFSVVLVAVIALLLVPSKFIFSQENIHKEIIWDDYIVNGKQVLLFEGNFIIDENSGLPRLQLEVPMDDPNIEYTIGALDYDKTSINKIPSLAKSYYLHENPDIKINYSEDSGTKKVLLDILPFSYSSENEFLHLKSFTLIPTQQKNSTSFKSFASSSVLSSGNWYKFKLTEDGIYRITYDELNSAGLTNLDNIRIYGNGGTMLPFHNAESFPDDLIENSIYMEKGTDNVFNEGDYILFYGKGPIKWNWDTSAQIMSHECNLYSDAAYYFMTTSFGPGKRIEMINSTTKTPNFSVTTFNVYDYHEVNLENLIHSGRTWYGEALHENDFSKSFMLHNICTDSVIHFKSQMAGRAGGSREVDITINGENISDNFSAVDITTSWTLYADDITIMHDFTSNSDQINVSVAYSEETYEDKAYLDYVSINAWRKLIYDNSVLKFFNSASVGENKVSEFALQNANENVVVWEISDIYNVKEINATRSGNELNFTLETDTLRTFIAFDLENTAYKSPVFTDESDNIGFIANQNLHAAESPDLLIVTHPAFINQAEELAQLHRDADEMDVYVATTDQVYNEFSSGARDGTAIRNFARMFYNTSQSGSGNFKYLLLFGDGSFDNLTNISGNTNYIPTYQSLESLLPTRSFGTDDFYGLLENDEGGYSPATGIDIQGDLDIGIGRIPVISDGENETEAQGVVDKIKAYYYNQDDGDWKNSMCFIGDDREYYNEDHMEDADSLANLININYPGFYVNKIMLDAYEQITTVSGPSYPEVNREIKKSFEKGILVFNYNGHGGPNGITAEKVFQKGDIENLRNIEKLPLFITATCQVSRYDDVEIDDAGNYAAKNSAGEAVLLNPEGGGIGLFTTTRVVYQNPNFKLNKNIYDFLFEKDEAGRKLRLGDAFREGKNATTGDNGNKLNFILLGDPAVSLQYPEYKVITDSINNKPIEEPFDTLKAFSEVTVSGYIANEDSTMMEDFNGDIYPKVLDKVINVTTQGNDGMDLFVFQTQNNVLFKGKASVNNGRFKFSFIVPKDISYNLGNGKIIYYARNDEINAHGYTNNIFIGGTNEDADIDVTGPDISLFLNDTNFTDGDISNESPYVYAQLYDEHGINTTGIGIGHDIVAILDNDYSNPYILNDYFEGAADNYRAGYVNYQLFDLEPGKHELILKAWDTYNNSSEEIITFYVHQSDKLVLGKLMNYPNPTSGYTYFQYHHNWPETEHEVTIDIFTLTGARVATLNTTNYESGYVSSPIEWNGITGTGAVLSNGIYPYRVTVKTEEGLTSTMHSKLVVFR